MTAVRSARSLFLFCACAFVAGACAAREKPTRSPGALAVESSSPPARSAAAPAPQQPQPQPQTLRQRANDPAYAGVLDRAGLLAIIDQGLGRVLARLKLSAVIARGRFVGFRVTEIDPAWASAGIEVDDVLLRLNGQPIERPEQAQAAFESLRVASEVALELLRGDHKHVLRFRVE